MLSQSSQLPANDFHWPVYITDNDGGVGVETIFTKNKRAELN